MVLVLWVSLGLVALALTFGHSMMMTYRGADNELAGAQADQAIEGAVRYAETLLANAEKPGEFPDVTSYTSEAVPVGEATFWFIGRPTEKDSNTSTPVFGLVDEASKLNLNTATIAMLEALPGMTTELAAAIKDWRDEDDEISESGAESETYMLRSPSYSCKNANFESIEELALVNGADSTILYGEDANLNGVLDPNEDDGSKSLPEDDANGRLDPGIFEYVTAFTREPNTKTDGTARTNVATMNDTVRTYLSDKFGSTRGPEIAQQLGTSTTFRSVLEFFIRGGLTADEQDQIVNEVTITDGDFIPGRVNVNSASETVLACIPGILDKASSLVATRQSRTQQGTNMSWIVQVLGDDGAIQAGPYITGSSYQVTADVAAVGRHGRGYRRTTFVIDMSTGSPRVIYRRNLSPLGWALGSDVRQTLAMRKEAR
ncbi:general secretion pathway protein GspK [Verrucomicrobiota bacterium sgz303538]